MFTFLMFMALTRSLILGKGVEYGPELPLAQSLGFPAFTAHLRRRGKKKGRKNGD